MYRYTHNLYFFCQNPLEHVGSHAVIDGFYFNIASFLIFVNIEGNCLEKDILFSLDIFKLKWSDIM